jgi:haloacetate dehalogenase
VVDALFPSFATRVVTGDGADIFCRVGGSGPPLALLHGYPQTHAMWHRVAPGLAETRSVVCMDLRGYGASSVPASDPDHRTYSKRAMARDVVAVMRALGHERFDVAGHDRGGRVAYRLAFDHPDRVKRLAVLDIVPTLAMWATMDAERAMKVYHWMMLAQPFPLPERLIAGAGPDWYLEQTIASWTKAKSLKPFDPRALAAYKASFAVPARLHASCEDYRAGQSIDRLLDAEDLSADRKITAPVLALWGGSGIPAREDGEGPLATWRRFATDVSGEAIDAGHFLPEEAPEATLRALDAFFTVE